MTVYLIVISIAAVVITLYDKMAAQARRGRVPERILLFSGAIGGALAMLITMSLIRHKTKQAVFMIGLPIMIVAHLVIMALLK